MTDGAVANQAGRFTLSDGTTTIAVQKIRTRNGHRLKVENSDTGAAIAIDPLGLESLAWQKPKRLAERFGIEAEDDFASAEPASTDGEQLFAFEMVNEFAVVKVIGRRVDDREVLTVEAPEVAFSITLGPDILAGIAAQDMDLFTSFLKTPYGP